MARFPVLPRITPENIDPELLAGSFVYFVQALWYDRGFDKVAPLSEMELEMCAWTAGEHPDFQPPPKNRGVLAFRGEGKTTKGVAAFCCYRFMRMPERQIVTCSKSDNAAKKTMHMMRSWLSAVWFLKHLEPKASQRDAKSAFDIGLCAGENRQPSMSCLGLGGQLENNRAHTFIWDDVETKGNTKTLDSRETLERMVQEGTNILYPDRAVDLGGPIDPCEIIVHGTVKHVETLYLKLFNKGYRFMTFPMEVPDPSLQILNLAGTIQRRINSGEYKVGDPTFPHRFPMPLIIERKAEGQLEYLMESMCVVGLANTHRYPLRLSDLIVFAMTNQQHPCDIAWGQKDHAGNSTLSENIPCLGMAGDRLCGPIMFDPRWVNFTRTIAYIDPAGKGDDEICLCIASTGAGKIWVHGVWGYQNGTGDAVTKIVKTCRQYNVRDIHYESNMDSFGSFKVSLEDAIRAEARIPSKEDIDMPWNAGVQGQHATQVKEARIISTLEPIMSTHRLVMHPQALIPAPEQVVEKSLQYQLAYLQNQPRCLKHDDRADVLAGAVGILVTNVPNHQTKEQTAGQRIDDMVRKFQGDKGPAKMKGWLARR